MITDRKVSVGTTMDHPISLRNR